jgi:hypothetical protein
MVDYFTIDFLDNRKQFWYMVIDYSFIEDVGGY